MKISVSYEHAPKTPTLNTSHICSQFGIGFEVGKNVIADEVEIPYEPGKIVLFTGSSGSGKSAMLSRAMQLLDTNTIFQVNDCTLFDCDLPNPFHSPVSLVDLFAGPISGIISALSFAGLGEAFLMLRSVAELSDGQRYRLAIARSIVAAKETIVADEWCSNLDRTTAKVLCRNIRKIATKKGIGFLLATAHDDLLEDLRPDIVVQCTAAGPVVLADPFAVTVQATTVFEATHKRISYRSIRRYGSAAALAPTGRTSLGGITEDTNSGPRPTSSSCGTTKSP